jgi:hypothetical protein
MTTYEAMLGIYYHLDVRGYYKIDPVTGRHMGPWRTWQGAARWHDRGDSDWPLDFDALNP